MANVKFSDEELALMNNAGFILTKNSITRKVYDLLGDLSARLSGLLKDATLPAEVVTVPPKISKGENYSGLPYVVLDHPRFFSREDVFTIRTMFWWGNYFLVTLHLKGVYARQYAGRVTDGYDLLLKNGFCLMTGKDEWQHHVEQGSSIPVSSINKQEFSELIHHSSFIKVTATVPLSLNEKAGEELFKKAEQLTGLLTH